PLRATEQVAERTVTTELAQSRPLGPRLNALGDDTDAVRVRQLDDRRNDGVVLEVRPDTADERPVQLHRLDGQLAKRSERRVPGAEVVERERDPDLAQPFEQRG